MKKEKVSHKKILIILIIILLIIDQITKIIFWKKGTTEVTKTDENLGKGYYIIISIIIVIMIIRYISNDNTFIKFGTKVVLSFGIAGAIGNVIDRIWLGNVITFIKITEELNFNFAYLYIIIAWVGMAGILAKNSMKFLNERKNKKVIKDEYEKNKSK